VKGQRARIASPSRSDAMLGCRLLLLLLGKGNGNWLDQTANQTTVGTTCCYTRAVRALAHSSLLWKGVCECLLFRTQSILVTYVAQPPCLLAAYNHILQMALTRTPAIHHRSRVTGLE